MQFRDRIVLNVVRGEGKMMPKARRRNLGVNKIQSNSSAPVAAALSNAVFDATGVRLRTVPFTPQRVRAALGVRS